MMISFQNRKLKTMPIPEYQYKTIKENSGNRESATRPNAPDCKPGAGESETIRIDGIEEKAEQFGSSRPKYRQLIRGVMRKSR